MQILSKKTKTITSLMLIIILDCMGFSLIFPLFPALFIAHNSVLVAHNTSINLKYIYYGLALASWPIGCFFGTAFWGRMSDNHGRKKILLLGLSMLTITYCLQAIALGTKQLALFLVARTIQGFFGGNYDMAQAAVSDISHNSDKARNMGFMALAGAIGIVLGPVVVSLITSANTFTTSNAITPFWFASISAFIAVLWTSIALKETFKPTIKTHIKLSNIFTSFLFILKDKRVTKTGMVLLLLSIGGGLYIQQIPIILYIKFKFTPHQLSIFFIALGLSLIITIKYIQPFLIKHFSIQDSYIYATITTVIALISTIIIPIRPIEWIAVFIVTACHICAYGCILNILSNSTEKHEQGKMMGAAGTVCCFSFALASIMLALLSTINLTLPIIVATISYLLAGITLLRNKKI